ncbi:ACP S-malonyltransferase [Candidatus Pacearchaeota archaeon]|nr:ACP S-malonyltransferase [Candidatus Pacearchaeota archaeon]
MICGVFPGQGNQFVGMGKDFYYKFDKAKEMYDISSEKTSIDIKKISFEGPEELQNDVLNLQLITFVNSCAILGVLNKKFDYLAGHSIGEYSALYAAGVFSFEKGLEIVKRRGELMKRISFDDSCLIAILGESKENIEDFCKKTGLEIALYNNPRNYVIGGLPEEIKKHYVKIPGKKIKLDVRGPFHTKHYKEISLEYKDFLKRFEFKEPTTNVYSNYSAEVYKKENIMEWLTNQLWHPVLWEQIINKNPCRNFVEIGPKNSLKKMIERIKGDARIFSIQKCEDLEAYNK